MCGECPSEKGAKVSRLASVRTNAIRSKASSDRWLRLKTVDLRGRAQDHPGERGCRRVPGGQSIYAHHTLIKRTLNPIGILDKTSG